MERGHPCRLAGRLAVGGTALVALVAATAGTPKSLPDVGFPYWPASARDGRAIPLRGGAAFRRALRRIATSAGRAGWIREGFDQARSGGSVTLWYTKPAPAESEVTVRLTWRPKAGRGELAYRVGIRPTASLVRGFPICMRRGLVGAVKRTGGEIRASARCHEGGFDLAPGRKATGLPAVYGWRTLGPYGRGFLFVRRGVYVEAATRYRGWPVRRYNEVFFHGHTDPRGSAGRHPALAAPAPIVGSKGPAVYGQVFDARGYPVPRATVAFVPENQNPRDGKTVTPRPAVATTQTDAVGAFRVTGLSDGPYVVVVRREGRIIGAHRYVSIPSMTPLPSRLQITLDKAVAFDGQVHLAGGVPAAGAEVEVTSLYFHLPKVRVDAKGRFHVLAPSKDITYQATIRAPGDPETRAVLKAGTNRITIYPVGTVTGVVIGARSGPVAGARVWPRGAPSKAVITDAEGHFAFPKLVLHRKAGPLVLLARKGVDAGLAAVPPGDHPAPVTLGLSWVPKGLEIHVVDPKWKPIPRARVDVGGQLFVAGADGVVKVPSVPVELATPGNEDAVTVRAKAPGHAPTEVPIRLMPGAGPTLIFLPLAPAADGGGTLAVRLRGLPAKERHAIRVGAMLLFPRGVPGVSNVTIYELERLEQVNPGIWRDRKVALDAHGRARFENLLAGRYLISFEGPPPMPRPFKVTVPRRAPVVVSVPKGETISGKVVDARGRPVARIGVVGQLSSFSDLGSFPYGTPWRVVTNRQGRFRAHGLDWGSYLVSTDGRPPYLSAPSAAIWAGRPPRPLRYWSRPVVLHVRRGLSITGRVVGLDGRPLAGAVLTVTVGKLGELLRERRGTLSWPTRARPIVSDRHGRFSVGNLRSGTYTLTVRHHWSMSRSVDVAAGAKGLTLVVDTGG